MKSRVLCIGETMAMVNPLAREPLTTSERFTIGAGGAESNVASHLAAMGLDVSWLGRLGEDALGDRILSELSRRQLSTRWIIRDDAAPTGVYFKDPVPGQRPAVSYYRAHSAASKMSTDDLAFWPMSEARWVHLTGITPALSQSCDALVEHVIDGAKERGYEVSFDVNYRAALWSVADAARRCQELGNRCHVVLVGLDEAHTLWGVTTAEETAALFPDAQHVVVKDGANEAVELERSADGSSTVVRVPANAVTVVEAVGAGDAFAAGFIGGMLLGLPSEARLAAGHTLAAWTLGSLDDYRPLPEKERRLRA